MAQETKENGKATLFSVVSILFLVGSVVWLYFSFTLGGESSALIFIAGIVLSLAFYFASAVIQLLDDIKQQLKKLGGKKTKVKKEEVE